ncbi:MAG: AAA family ATPase [Pseudomonadota bacterium]
MSRAGPDESPPYIGIDPKTAAERLTDPVDVRQFAYGAQLCARGRDDLVKRGYAPDGHKHLRRFSIWEITRYMLPMAPAHFRRVLKNHPELPQGQPEGGNAARWFTLEEVLTLRDFFAAEGSRSKPYKPYRPEGCRAKVIALSNFKGGVGKTSTAAHLSMAAALDGYRVLVIDLDSQGSLTSMLGGQVADEWQTAFALIAKDFATECMAASEPDGPAPVLDDTLRAALDLDVASVVQPTHWPNIDLIGAQLNLYWAEFQIPVWRLSQRKWQLWDALNRFLERERLLERYDIVVLDTPPALGYLTINALSAADILLVPVGANFLEFDSTGRFFDMLYTTFASIEDGENAANRALGLAEIRFEWDVVRALITRFDPTQQADFARVMEAYFGEFLARHRQEYTVMVGQAAEGVNSIYEADHREFNRETYLRGRETFDRTYAEVKELVLGCWWREALEREQEMAHGA